MQRNLVDSENSQACLLQPCANYSSTPIPNGIHKLGVPDMTQSIKVLRSKNAQNANIQE